MGGPWPKSTPVTLLPLCSPSHFFPNTNNTNNTAPHGTLPLRLLMSISR
jgi:hypothetical protein